MGNVSKELIGASAVKIIMAVLNHGDNYGYEIVQIVKRLSDGQINWHKASIYPLLKKNGGTWICKIVLESGQQ